MKKLTMILICALLVLVITGCGKNDTNPSNGTESVVALSKNNFKITADELYDTLKENYATSYLIQQIDTAILNNEYETNDEMNEYVDNQIKMYQAMYGNSESQLLEALQNAGYKDLAEFKATVLLNYKLCPHHF